MKKGSGGVVATVKKIAEPLAEELGYFLWDVEYVKEGADMYLRITIDSEEGINIEDCEKVHRAIDPILDEIDPIETFYYLEVSSPGVERELRTPEHILACIGMRAQAKLFTAVNGAKSVVGEIVSYLDDTLTLRTESGDVVLKKSQISRLCTVYFEEE